MDPPEHQRHRALVASVCAGAHRPLRGRAGPRPGPPPVGPLRAAHRGPVRLPAGPGPSTARGWCVAGKPGTTSTSPVRASRCSAPACPSWPAAVAGSASHEEGTARSQDSVIGGAGGPAVSQACSALISGPGFFLDRGKARLLVKSSPQPGGPAGKTRSMIGLKSLTFSVGSHRRSALAHANISSSDLARKSGRSATAISDLGDKVPDGRESKVWTVAEDGVARSGQTYEAGGAGREPAG